MCSLYDKESSLKHKVTWDCSVYGCTRPIIKSLLACFDKASRRHFKKSKCTGHPREDRKKEEKHRKQLTNCDREQVSLIHIVW